jgi:hypothetical protein
MAQVLQPLIGIILSLYLCSEDRGPVYLPSHSGIFEFLPSPHRQAGHLTVSHPKLKAFFFSCAFAMTGPYLVDLVQRHLLPNSD